MTLQQLIDILRRVQEQEDRKRMAAADRLRKRLQEIGAKQAGGKK